MFYVVFDFVVLSVFFYMVFALVRLVVCSLRFGMGGLVLHMLQCLRFGFDLAMILGGFVASWFACVCV